MVHPSPMDNLSNCRNNSKDWKKSWKPFFHCRKNSMEIELAKARLDLMNLDSQLMEAIQQKVELSQQLEQWEVSRMCGMRIVLLSQCEYRNTSPQKWWHWFIYPLVLPRMKHIFCPIFCLIGRALLHLLPNAILDIKCSFTLRMFFHCNIYKYRTIKLHILRFVLDSYCKSSNNYLVNAAGGSGNLRVSKWYLVYSEVFIVINKQTWEWTVLDTRFNIIL